jgi:hypothetical protein
MVILYIYQTVIKIMVKMIIKSIILETVLLWNGYVLEAAVIKHTCN